MVQKGLNNKKILAVFSEPTPTHIQNTLNWMLSSTSDQKTPLIVNIRKLHISEKTTAWKEYGIAEVSLEFLTIDSLSYGIFQAKRDITGMDVTEKHPQIMSLVLEDCLREFSNSKKEPTKRLFLDKQLVKSFNESTNLEDGVYNRFSAFQNNQPTESLKFDLKKRKGKIERYKLYKKGSQESIKLDIFGICQNKEIYMSCNSYAVGNYYVKAQLKGRYLYFEDKFTPNPAATAAIGGLLGYYALKEKAGVILDTTSGLIQVLNGKVMRQLLEEHPGLLEKYEKNNHSLAAKKVFIRALNKR